MEFNFDAVNGPSKPTKTARFKDDTREPSATCESFNCKRSKNLWPYEFDTKTIWLCWPHYRRYKSRPSPYKGRMKHHDFARQHLAGPDYGRAERLKHRDFAGAISRGDFSVLSKRSTGGGSGSNPSESGPVELTHAARGRD